MFGLVPWRKEWDVAWPAEPALADLRHEFRTLANRLFNAWPAMPEEFLPERMWNVNVTDTEKEVLVRMEAPGFEPEEFDLEVRDNRLIVKAEHMEKKEPTEAKEPAKEMPPKVLRRFERVVTLPEVVEPEKAEANYRHGMLEIRLPRMEEVKPRRIPVLG
jgi:HSP20 family protein